MFCRERLLTVALVSSLLSGLVPGESLAGQKPKLAPMNLDYLEFSASRAHDPQPQVSDADQPLGFVPPPLDLPHLDRQRVTRPFPTRFYPPRFDLREEGRVPPMKAQGSCGSCWVFATMGSLESCHWQEEQLDVSENNLNNLHGFYYSPCSGGNHSMSTAYFARWGGPMSEADDPYLDYDSPTDIEPIKHVQDVIYIGNRAGPDDNDVIKEMITTHGAVFTTYRVSNTYYNEETFAFYYPNGGSCNHAVAIVGWDDDFSRDNFNHTPPGDGAFIIRNSWGSDWGDGGYFYMSYYESTLKYNTVFHHMDPPTNYSFNYQHDPFGWVASIGEGGFDEQDHGGVTARQGDPEKYWGANIFENTTDEHLAAVSFYTASYGSSYLVQIYTEVVSDPSDGTLAGETSGTLAYPGYHTIALDHLDIQLPAGTRFSVVVEFTTPGYDYPVPIEYPASYYCSNAEASVGESFVRPTLSDAWVDLTSLYNNSNVCIKAFTWVHCEDGDPCTDDIVAGPECDYPPTVCDDGNPCTDDFCLSETGCQALSSADCLLCGSAGVCVGGACQEGAQNEDIGCDDASACTQLDLCQGGFCAGLDPIACIPLSQCHDEGICDPATGICSDPPKEDDTPCSDAEVCTLSDTCQDGVCLGASPATDGTACDDFDICTMRDTCQAGVCTGSDPIPCPEPDQCHLPGNCDPLTGTCTNPPREDDTPCDDGNQCTAESACQAGICTPSGPAADGTVCDDGNLCTRTDACESGECIGSAAVNCPARDQCHQAGTCEPALGVCLDVPQPNGTPCDDREECTQADVCQSGACVASDLAPDGSSCNDGNLCTQTDSCSAGVCMGANPIECPGADPCHLPGICNPQTGECFPPATLEDGTSCDDNDPCTVNDECTDGACAGTPLPKEACHPVDPGDGESTGCGCANQAGSPGTTGLLWLLILMLVRCRKP